MESMQQSMAEMVQNFNTTMAEFQAKLDKAPVNPTVASVASQFDAFRAFVLKAVESLQHQMELQNRQTGQLSQQVDNLEMQLRRKILLFHGVPEAGAEDTTSRIVDLLKSHLKGNLTADDISRSHRLGRPRSNQTRTILVKFRNITDRNTVWFDKIAFKGSGVIVSEFLTKPRHEVFMAARQRFGVRNCFTRDGTVFVLAKEGVRHSVSSRADLDRLEGALPSEPAAAAGAQDAAAPAPLPASSQPGKRATTKRQGGQGAVKPRI